MRLPDATDAPPIRRMSVVGARLTVPGDAPWAPHVHHAQAAALLAAKTAHERHPALLQAPLTDAFLEVTPLDDTRLAVTFTTQAYARLPLTGHAHAGLGAALATLLAALPGSQADEVRTIQDVPGA